MRGLSLPLFGEEGSLFFFRFSLTIFLIFVLYFLFHLRNWARKIFLFSLIIFFLYSIFCLIFQKDLHKEYAESIKKIGKKMNFEERYLIKREGNFFLAEILFRSDDLSFCASLSFKS
ncbi:MAG: hypothetical protein B6D56_00505 [Candidatus Omnitrophica bacterium 4484_70.1]|nr:MAG: hypothetical protein B6D56_00505 [Candidatus Omnitrophica bacterium 4484_70.1]